MAIEGDKSEVQNMDDFLPPNSPTWLLKKVTLPPSEMLSSLLPSECIAPVWGGETRDKPHEVRTRVGVCCLNSQFNIGMGGACFQVGLLSSQNETKKSTL